MPVSLAGMDEKRFLKNIFGVNYVRYERLRKSVAEQICQ